MPRQVASKTKVRLNGSEWPHGLCERSFPTRIGLGAGYPVNSQAVGVSLKSL